MYKWFSQSYLHAPSLTPSLAKGPHCTLREEVKEGGWGGRGIERDEKVKEEEERKEQSHGLGIPGCSAIFIFHLKHVQMFLRFICRIFWMLSFLRISSTPPILGRDV